MLLEQVRLEQVARTDQLFLDYLQAQMFHKLSVQCYCGVIVVIVVSQGRLLLFIIMLILVCSQSVPVDIRTLTTQ